MHQKLALILQQLCYGKISFIVLVPGLLVLSVPLARLEALSAVEDTFKNWISTQHYLDLVQRKQALVFLMLGRSLFTGST